MQTLFFDLNDLHEDSSSLKHSLAFNCRKHFSNPGSQSIFTITLSDHHMFLKFTMHSFTIDKQFDKKSAAHVFGPLIATMVPDTLTNSAICFSTGF